MHNCPNCGVALTKFEPFTHGNVHINVARDIELDGVRVPLFPTAKQIVEVLVRGRGRVMSRDTLLGAINSENFERTIDVYIRRAREGFKQIDPSFDQIRTIQKLGYAWVYKHSNDMAQAA